MDEIMVNQSENTKVKLTGIKILVAEDEDTGFRVIERILNEYGINSIRATNGKEAVELVDSNPNIDIILMDIKMPVMNGIEAARMIKSKRPDLPIIANSAFAMPGDKQVFKDAGCEEFISKPIDAEQLISLIRKLVKM